MTYELRDKYSQFVEKSDGYWIPKYGTWGEQANIINGVRKDESPFNYSTQNKVRWTYDQNVSNNEGLIWHDNPKINSITGYNDWNNKGLSFMYKSVENQKGG